MNVSIDRSTHTVHITGQAFLSLSPEDAYNLFRRLEEKKAELYDLATNFYDCKECGGVHRKGEQCPTLTHNE